MAKPPSVHYVKNDDFFKALIEYKTSVKDAEEIGEPKPKVTDYIGECILKIAVHLSYRPNFIGYTYRDDMVSDGINNCLTYLTNFDPEKSKNPFAYFTQIIYFAFLRRIKQEKKQTLIKGKIIMAMPFDVFDVQSQDEGESYVNTYVEFMRGTDACKDVVEAENVRVLKKKKKKTLPPVELNDIFEEEV
jgi:hypothetical protein